MKNMKILIWRFIILYE